MAQANVPRGVGVGVGVNEVPPDVTANLLVSRVDGC